MHLSTAACFVLALLCAPPGASLPGATLPGTGLQAAETFMAVDDVKAGMRGTGISVFAGSMVTAKPRPKPTPL